MSTHFLLPHRWKPIGWVMLTLGGFLGAIFLMGYDSIEWLNMKVPMLLHEGLDMVVSNSEAAESIFQENNVLDELSLIFLILGGVVAAFAKVSEEDEYTAHLRLESLVWATYVNYGIMLLGVLFVYDLSFFWVMVFNMFTLLLFFLVRFHWKLFQMRKIAAYAE
jgi:hypothetical protein